MRSRCLDDVVYRWRIGSSGEQRQAGNRGYLAGLLEAQSSGATVGDYVM